MSLQAKPSPGFVRLVLFSDERGQFCLEIPVDIVHTVCLKPLKYLRYLGWCILGVEGSLVDTEDVAISLDGELHNQGVYRYKVPGGDPLAHAVDLEVIKQRSGSRSTSRSTATREDFRSKLMERDGCCVWTTLPGVGMHIIPFRRGDEWLRLIVNNRLHDEDLDTLDINDIRNGICANSVIRGHFDAREVVVLKTPNVILETTDVPNRCPREEDPSMSFPEGSRYTMQWLIQPNTSFQRFWGNNNDAAFLNQSLPKPSDVLLHYNYGAAAVKHWGKTTDILSERNGIPRPLVPTLSTMGRSKHDFAGANKNRAQTDTTWNGQVADSEGQIDWDEDDVVLQFWANSPKSRERAAQRQQQRDDFIANWKSGLREAHSV